ncbi:SGS domain-containing protein [Dioszegia hungarica]|uniref:SGS domain-containing protein n=1 Tax=Dioszegia hungarica TaxID=4972 RepID=A0AA38LWC6_9TREE|nr:SGS domain-containing protein [Dioszegia hungarica]KAI9638235.1 SGS domain-containing protein [Dioszegia hungarica]
MSGPETPLPRHDFYQNEEYVIVAVYIKGLNVEGVKEKVDISFEDKQATIVRPNPEAEGEKLTVKLGPLYAGIKADESTSRILSSKIELKLRKAEHIAWTTLLSTPESAPPRVLSQAPPANATASSSTAPPPTETEDKRSDAFADIGMASSSVPHAGGPAKINNKRKNWDRVVEEELKVKKEDRTAADPNSGGDNALQKMFADIYKDADPDTKRAMIKSFTESGGTTLSTDWNSIGKEKTPIRPPDGMEARKY